MRNCWMNQSRIRTQSIKCIPKEIELSDRLWRMLNNGLTQRVQLEKKVTTSYKKDTLTIFFPMFFFMGTKSIANVFY